MDETRKKMNALLSAGFIKYTDIKEEEECLHLRCTECRGTGKKANGESCIHYLSCPCPRCTVSY